MGWRRMPFNKEFIEFNKDLLFDDLHAFNDKLLD